MSTFFLLTFYFFGFKGDFKIGLDIDVRLTSPFKGDFKLWPRCLVSPDVNESIFFLTLSIFFASRVTLR